VYYKKNCRFRDSGWHHGNNNPKFFVQVAILAVFKKWFLFLYTGDLTVIERASGFKLAL
jgi:hypothetical protein